MHATTSGCRYGVAISGGGHRATAWALGSLLYLVETGANQTVGSIASVSGGSLANAFVASRAGAFNEIADPESRDTFVRDVGGLARELAGRPWVWWATAASHVGALAAGAAFLAVEGRTGWWKAGLLWVGWLVLAVVLGPKADGTLWSSPLMWVYMGVLGPGLVITISLWWLESWWVWRGLLVTAAAALWSYLFAQRGAVAALAFSKSVCHPRSSDGGRPSRGRHRRLSEIEHGVHHVFCATEMHAGEHAYFSAEFVYSPGFGIGVPGKTRLHTAVQASANFPGGFPLRMLRAKRFDFVLGRQEQRITWLVLTDGGVFDNMADAWFLDLRNRATQLGDALRAVRTAEQPALMRGHEIELRRRLKAMMDSFPRTGETSGEPQRPGAALIVLNGAPSERWARLDRIWLPGLGEVFGFTKIAKVQYNNSTSTRGRDLVRRFANDDPPGALVTIEADPESVALGYISRFTEVAWTGDEREHPEACQLGRRLYDALADPRGFAGVEVEPGEVAAACLQLGLTEERAGRTERSVRTMQWLEGSLAVASPPPLRDVRSWSHANRGVRTHLNPLGRETAARLLQHSYLQAMATLYVTFGEPFALMSAEQTSLARFRALSAGNASPPGTASTPAKRGAVPPAEMVGAAADPDPSEPDLPPAKAPLASPR